MISATLETEAGAPVLNLDWFVDGPIDPNVTVFVHVLNEAGQVVAQADGDLVGGYVPIGLWPINDRVLERRVLPVHDLPIGKYTVAIGSDLAVPNTKVTIKVLAFLPQFSMGDQEITSKSNEPLMPAAQVVIQEPGKPEWKGWLFSAAPDMHPYEHEKLSIKLAGGVAK